MRNFNWSTGREEKFTEIKNLINTYTRVKLNSDLVNLDKTGVSGILSGLSFPIRENDYILFGIAFLKNSNFKKSELQ